MFKTKNSKIKIYTDGANLDSIIKLAKDDLIDGITTNPTLMKKSGVTNYMKFAKLAVKASQGKSLSLEVFSDDLDEMINQAYKLSNLGDSVVVKIPITNSKGISTKRVIKELINKKISVNITAILSLTQIDECLDLIQHDSKIYISVFAGRIADTGRDPKDFIKHGLNKLNTKNFKKVEFLWASTREVYNIYEAADIGCNIITVSPSILEKLRLKYYDLEKLSLETVQMFKSDSESAQYIIE